MTLNEMILEVWQMTGESTDIDPTDGTANPTALTNIDTSTKGYTRIVTALNQAQVAVATHRQKRGRQFRWKGGYKTSIITMTPSTTTSDTAVAVGDFSISTNLSGSADDWNDWFIEVGNETRRVVDSSAAGDLTVGKAFEQVHDSGVTVTLLEFPQSLESDLWVIDQIWDFYLQKTVGPTNHKDLYLQEYVAGEPAEYWRDMLDLYFSGGNFDNTRKYSVRYRRLPLDMSSSQETELPDNFHWALVLWAAGWGYWRQQDPAERKNLRDEFADFMKERQMENMAEAQGHDAGGRVREDYGRWRR